MPRDVLVARTLVEMADSLVDEFDVVDLLTRLSDRCLNVLDVSAAGVMLAAPSGGLQVVASSSEAMRTLQLFELEAEEGPCVDCYATGTPILNLDLFAVGGRWPRFTTRAAADGFRSVHALPLRLRGRSIGALTLFQTDRATLAEDDVTVAQALADVATIAILQHQAVIDAQIVNQQLTQALNSRIVIEQAKGRISEASGVDIEQAFRRLRNHARNHNIRLAELSGGIANGTINPRSLDPLTRRPDD